MTSTNRIKQIDTNNLTVDFGKHKGEVWTRVPADYLRWLINQPDEVPQFGNNKEIAKAELDRRGTVVSSEVELSPHSIDKASLRLRRIWHETALNGDEGIYSWLSRVATEALRTTPERPTLIKYRGIKFVFKQGSIFPVLKTVMIIKI